jgi:hypothetical protein
MRIQALAGATMWVVMVAAGGVAAADPGELVANSSGSEVGPLQLVDGAACNLKSGLCLRAGAAATVAVASAPVASATPDSPSAKTPPVVPRFERVGNAAETPWTLEFAANLKKAALKGNALFIFFDLEDPGCVENRQYTALYQAPIKAGPKVAARVALAPDEGFRAGHTYRIRVIQLINGKEILLTEGDVALQ